MRRESEVLKEELTIKGDNKETKHTTFGQLVSMFGVAMCPLTTSSTPEEDVPFKSPDKLIGRLQSQPSKRLSCDGIPYSPCSAVVNK